MQPAALLKNDSSNVAVTTLSGVTTNNPLQLKTGLEEDEKLQLKRNPLQLVADDAEEPLQMKQNPLQLMDDEDDELLQTKENPLQQKKRNQNPLQLKLSANNPLQLQVSETTALQPKKNNTGLPDNLKEGVETLSGYSMDDVKVHYNSDKPAQLQALAYAQGTDIHVAPGQEQHLPHEAWHVVQQKQGRVQPTMQTSGGVNINDDVSLENEADAMGHKTIYYNNNSPSQQKLSTPSSTSIQAVFANAVTQLVRTVTNSQKTNMQTSLARVYGGPPTRYVIDQDSGTTFNDNNGNDTTGHHGVSVTDTADNETYSCDFHQNGLYYTRG